MIVTPQVNYVTMMLPLSIPSITFRQLDDVIKHFLWGGKRPRIKLRKLCAHKEEGGLCLPDLRLYYLAFEMAKIARYWQTADSDAAWMEIEKEICWPFKPLQMYSQKRSNITNPILKHSRDVWTRVHRMFKLTYTLQRYSSLWYNPDVCIGKKPVYWKRWHSNGLGMIDDLFEEGVFLSYDMLLRKFNLAGNDNFWKFLQIRSCITSKSYNISDNVVIDYMKLPLRKRKASEFYKIINSSLNNDCNSLRIIWQRDLGREIDSDRWERIVADCGKYVREVRSKLTQYNVLHRYYYTPSRLHRMKLQGDDLCWKCKEETGTLLHCMWDCVLIKPFWTQILIILSNWLRSKIPSCPELCLLGDRSQLPQISKCHFSVISVGVATACRIILRHWKALESPQVKEWVYAMTETASYESMLTRLSDDGGKGATPWDGFWDLIKINNDLH